jgi:multiple sugar transport system permease protein
MVSTSLMDEFEVLRFPPVLLPSVPKPGNYAAALTALPFGRFFLNSLIFAGTAAVAQVATSAAAAYAFARLRFPGRDRVFFAFLSVLMVPAIVLLIPRFLLVNALGWVDTWAGLLSTAVSVWGIFLLRQFFQTLPRDLGAARLDRAGSGRIRRVVLPLWSGPRHAQRLLVRGPVEELSLAADRDPLLDMRVAELGIASFHGIYYTNWPHQMAAAVAGVVPLPCCSSPRSRSSAAFNDGLQ